MDNRLIAFGFLCLTVIGCLAMWFDPTGREIAAAAVGAIAGALTTKAASNGN